MRQRYLRSLFPLNICLCLSEAEFNSMIRREKLEPEDYPADAMTMCFWRNGVEPFLAVMLPELKSYPWAERLGVVVHESTHVWQFIVEHILGNEKQSSELEAYAIQHISQWIFEELKKEKWL